MKLLLLCLLLSAALAAAEDGFRDDCDDAADWAAQPHWQANVPDEGRYGVAAQDGVAVFRTAGRGRAM